MSANASFSPPSLVMATIGLSLATFMQVLDCSGLMKPDTHLGENARQIEVSDDQTTPLLFR